VPFFGFVAKKPKTHLTSSRSHLHDLIESTKFVHYETHRTMTLQAKKDKKKKEGTKKKE